MGGHPTLIQSVQRALRLIEVIAEHGGRAWPKEIARAAELPLPTTYHLLRTCAHEGWLQRLGDGSYVLGHRIDVVRAGGTAARGVAHARPALEWLRDELGGAVYLARYAEGEIVVAEIVDSARAPRIDLWVGLHDAAHATALGKSILGQLSPADRTVFWGTVNPLEGRRALDLMERQVGEFGAKAFKFYNVRYDYGQPFPWRMDDPRVAFPVFEKAQELSLIHI